MGKPNITPNKPSCPSRQNVIKSLMKIIIIFPYLPSNKSFTSLAACSPASRRSLSIFLLLSAASLSAALLIAHPMAAAVCIYPLEINKHAALFWKISDIVDIRNGKNRTDTSHLLWQNQPSVMYINSRNPLSSKNIYTLSKFLNLLSTYHDNPQHCRAQVQLVLIMNYTKQCSHTHAWTWDP